MRTRINPHADTFYAVDIDAFTNPILLTHYTDCIIISDGAPDYSPNFIFNLLFYYRLSKKLDFDYLSVSACVAGFSAYKPINMSGQV